MAVSRLSAFRRLERQSRPSCGEAAYVRFRPIAAFVWATSPSVGRKLKVCSGGWTLRAAVHAALDLELFSNMVEAG